MKVYISNGGDYSYLFAAICGTIAALALASGSALFAIIFGIASLCFIWRYRNGF